MNNDRAIPSDEELTAFIDGELDEVETARLERSINADPRAAERLEHLRRADSLDFKQAFSLLLEAAPRQKLETALNGIPARKQGSKKNATVSRRGFLAAIAASAAAAVFIDRNIIGLSPQTPPQEDESTRWRAVVAQYISLYTADTLAGPIPAREQQERELANLGRHLKLTLLPEMASLPGIDFKRAQILQYDDRPLGQIVYLDPQTGPLALCIVASNAGASGPDTEIRKGMNTVYWSTSTHAYMLLGHASAQRIDALANELRQQLA